MSRGCPTIFKLRASHGLLCHVSVQRDKNGTSSGGVSAGVSEWQKHRCSFVSTGGTTVHWHSEKASIQSLFFPHTLAEWETSDLSLLYYPDAPAPLGNEILYYAHHAMPSSSARQKTNGETAVRTWKQRARGTPEDVMGTWWARPDPASVTAGALISVSAAWAVLTT